MSVVNRSTINSLINQLQVSSQTHLTGQLDVQATIKHGWKLYFHTGRLVWATGGVHRFRRWSRCLSQFCPQVNLNSIYLEVGTAESWEYPVLTVLTRRGQVTQEQAVAVIENTLKEVLFDILQAVELEPLTYKTSPQGGLEFPLTVLSSEQMLLQVQQALKMWCQTGLMYQSPNLAPVVKRPDELRQQMSLPTYQKIAALVNGKLSLRDLAAQMRQDLLILTRSLMPYVHKGLVDLVEVEDLPSLVPPPKATNQSAAQSIGSLVVCVDDSVQICQRLQEILTQAGYQFVSVQESVRVLPVILERKPSLIFLDLVMPVASGYEICAQIRKISIFKQTPVVILTGNDGILDRVRAKTVGASDFLAKPIKAELVLAVVQKHLKTAATPALESR
ncbi:MAG: response regulator [Chroococcidiopsidaceae cyanobacterium CP_BM_ER_R8_30]|nr:response regulator [Chroococcidiopsidaceae cyanobacterium CP_BM_ER_R8_30]